jgi:CBS-domain-containing membrane protein
MMLVKERMRRKKVHHLPVLDRDDHLAGIVTEAVARAGGNIIAMGTPLAQTIEDVRGA